MAKAFTLASKGRLLQLKTDVVITSGDNSIKTVALWDTGASGTAISEEIASSLSLERYGSTSILTPSGTCEVSRYLIDSITLPNGVRITDIPVSDSKIGNQGIGVLVGMDIITFGDLSISNKDGNTVFSFRIPSMKTIDFVNEENVRNKIGAHGNGKKNKKRKR